MAEAEDKPAVTQSQAHISQAGPAIYANRVQVDVGPVVRLSFMEVFGPDKANAFRAAVALPHGTAIELANILKRLLAEIERDIEAYKAELAAQEGGAPKTDG